jgi:hypothetical protein
MPRNPVLRFNPTAWAKLNWFCLRGETEVGGFAVTDPADPLYVIDFVTVRQDADWASIKFDDVAVADFFDNQVDLGRKPENFGRIWCHTHPGDSPTPSCVDEECFIRVFGKCQWAVMFVLARTGKVYARLRFNIGPGCHMEIPVQVDWSRPFAGTDHTAWLAEYTANIKANLSRLRGLAIDDALWGDEAGQGQNVKPAPQEPAEPFGAMGDDMTDPTDIGEDWLELFDTVDWDDLETAAGQVCSQWGLVDFADWQDAVGSLTPDKQREFRQAAEAILFGRQRTEELTHA